MVTYQMGNYFQSALYLFITFRISHKTKWPQRILFYYLEGTPVCFQYYIFPLVYFEYTLPLNRRFVTHLTIPPSLAPNLEVTIGNSSQINI
jgi:hypothetical protein